MPPFRTVLLLGALAFSLFAVNAAHASTVDVTVDVTSIGGVGFQYDYSIADHTGELFDLDIAVTPGTVITGLKTPGPAGSFDTAYDSVLGLVSFLENNGVFSPTPEAGFIFDSPTRPGASTFTANLAIDGITTQTGNVTAPIATPEPSLLAICGLAGAALVLWHKKKLVSSKQ